MVYIFVAIRPIFRIPQCFDSVETLSRGNGVCFAAGGSHALSMITSLFVLERGRGGLRRRRCVRHPDRQGGRFHGGGRRGSPRQDCHTARFGFHQG